MVRLGLPKNRIYCNAGFMYMNLALWRRDEIMQQCLNYYCGKENINRIVYGEQDVLIAICSEKIHVLPIEYNMMQHYYLHSNQYVLEQYKSSIAIHKANAIAIHYICAEKPWFKDSTFPLSCYYHKYKALKP